MSTHTASIMMKNIGAWNAGSQSGPWGISETRVSSVSKKTAVKYETTMIARICKSETIGFALRSAKILIAGGRRRTAAPLATYGFSAKNGAGRTVSKRGADA